MSAAPEPQENEQDPDAIVAIEGDVTDYWSYTLTRDYLKLLPGLPDAGLRLYDIFRSMVSEASRNRPGAGLRRMTIDQLCYLMPGSNGKAEKPVSVSAMYELLATLERLDLIVPKDTKEATGASQFKGKEKAAKAILRGYVVKDLPPSVFTGWRNAWDKLDAYRPDWRTNPVEPPTHLTSYDTDDAGRQIPRYWVGPLEAIEAFQNSGTGAAEDPEGEPDETPDQDPFQNPGTPFQNSGTAGQNPGTDLAPTCENAGSQRSLSKKSFSLSGAAPDGAEQGEREEAAEEDPDALQVLAAYEQALGGQALNGTRAQLLKDATALLAIRPLPWVIERARELPRFGKSLARHAEMSRVPFARSERKPEEGACLRHPGFQEDDCSRCRKEDQQRSQRDAADLAPVSGSALLASLRAGLNS